MHPSHCFPGRRIAIGSPLTSWIDGHVGGNPEQKVLLWVRTGDHDALRNTCFDELHQLSDLVSNAGLTPIFFGDAVPAEIVPTNGVNLTLCWKNRFFQGGPDMRRAQLQLFEELRCRHGLVGQIGVTTAGMDGPALIGLPTLYLTQERNVRLGKWVGAVPGYQEVVRGGRAISKSFAPVCIGGNNDPRDYWLPPLNRPDCVLRLSTQTTKISSTLRLFSLETTDSPAESAVVFCIYGL